MFGIFKGFKEFIFGSKVKVDQSTEAPYKVETPIETVPTLDTVITVSEQPAPAENTFTEVSDVKVTISSEAKSVPAAKAETAAKKARKPRVAKSVVTTKVKPKATTKNRPAKKAAVKEVKSRSKKA